MTAEPHIDVLPDPPEVLTDPGVVYVWCGAARDHQLLRAFVEARGIHVRYGQEPVKVPMRACDGPSCLDWEEAIEDGHDTVRYWRIDLP